jgi:hypothetical protein
LNNAVVRTLHLTRGCSPWNCGSDSVTLWLYSAV